MKKIILISVFSVLTLTSMTGHAKVNVVPGFIGPAPSANAVPEIDASFIPLSISLVTGVIALLAERRRK